jgi:hypothetical protein
LLLPGGRRLVIGPRRGLVCVTGPEVRRSDEPDSSLMLSRPSAVSSPRTPAPLPVGQPSGNSLYPGQRALFENRILFRMLIVTERHFATGARR